MDTAEIVPSHVQGNGSFLVLQFLAVSIGKASEAAKVHPKTQVPPFDVAGRDVAGIRHSVDLARDLLENGAGAVPVGASIGRVLEDFDELGVVGTGPKQVLDRFEIRGITIGGELKISVNAISQLGNKLVSVIRAALASVVGKDHFTLRIHRNPQVRVAPIGGIVFVGPGFFGVTKTPNLIRLDELRGDRSDAGIEQCSRSFASTDHQRHDGVLVDLHEAGDSPDRHTLKHHRENLAGAVNVGVVSAERLFGRIGKSGFAGMAAVALDSALAVCAELIGCIVLAADAGHGLFSLALGGEKSHTIYGSRAWVTPRFGLAPRPVRAGSGALFEGRYLARWFDGYFYRVTCRSARDSNRYPHCRFRLSQAALASDTRLGGSYLAPKLFLLWSRESALKALEASSFLVSV